MSEKQQRSDADAVLSSVRRLVTQHAPFADPMNRPHAAEEDDGFDERAPEAGSSVRASGDQPNPAAERLLLTPALRIAEAASDPEPEVAPERPEAGRRRSELEERIAELERAVGSQAEEWEPDGSEPIDLETPDNFAFHHAAAPEADDREAVSLAEFLREKEREEQAKAETATVVPIALVDEESLERSAEDGEDAENQQVPAHDTGDIDKLDNGDVIAERTDAADATVEAAEPGDAGQPDVSGEDAIIDEEALQELVARLVRSELKGELGERITRNIRKLVRREIHRELLTRGIK